MLVDGDDFYAVLAGVRGLRRAGYRPWLLVPPGNTYAARSRAIDGSTDVVSPGADPAGFVTAAGATAARVGAAAILPGTEAALDALAESAIAFPDVAVGVPPADVVARATDKEAFGELAAAAGLATPRTLTIARDEVATDGLRFPVIVKPLRTKTRVGTALVHGKPRVARDASELAAAIAALAGDRLIVQEHIPGGLGAIAGVAWSGELVCAVHQRAVRISPPEAGISALARTVPRDAPLEAGVARFVALLGWSGVFQLQFVHAGDRAYAIDFNPRLYGSLALAIAAGANLPAVWVDLLLGRAPRPAPYRVGVTYRSEEKELQAVLLALRRRDLRTALDVVRPHPGATHAAFAPGDPAPLLASLRKALGAYGSFRQTDSATSAESSSRGRVESSARTPSRSWWRR